MIRRILAAAGPYSLGATGEAGAGHADGSSNWALAGLSLAMLLPSLATSIANAALPALAQAFGAPFQAVQWIILSYLVAVTALVVAAGRLGDLVGRRRLLLAGTAMFAVASLLCGLSPTLILLIAARTIQGLGAAIMMALTIAFVGDAVPASQRGRAMGLLGTMSAVGTTLGPALGGFLIALAGARAIFLILVPLGTLAFALLARTLPADQERAKNSARAFDWTGTGLLVCTLTGYALAMTIGRGQFGLLNVSLVLAALVSGALFLLVEARAPAPLLRLSLFSDRVLSAGLATNALVATVMMTTLVVGPFYLTGALGLGGAMTGLVLSVGPLVAALAGLPAGRLVDRYGSYPTGLAGSIAIAAGALALSLLPLEFGLAGYIVPIIAMTTGYALFQASNTTGIMANVGPAERGVVSGMVSLARNLGLVTGASAMGAVFSYSSATGGVVEASSEAIAHGLHAAFAIATVLASLATVIATRRAGRSSTAMA